MRTSLGTVIDVLSGAKDRQPVWRGILSWTATGNSGLEFLDCSRVAMLHLSDGRHCVPRPCPKLSEVTPCEPRFMSRASGVRRWCCSCSGLALKPAICVKSEGALIDERGQPVAGAAMPPTFGEPMGRARIRMEVTIPLHAAKNGRSHRVNVSKFRIFVLSCFRDSFHLTATRQAPDSEAIFR